MKKYHRTIRRSLLDMHIPGWDPAFLSEYDPVALADNYAKANVEGVLLYCKSHMGLSYWPTPVGGVHPAAQNRDLVGELVDALRERGISPAAYHSVIFDNWAAETHPDWEVKSASTLRGDGNRVALGRRYGTMCPNNPEYLAHEITQIQALLSRYEFDALWVDMVFWTAICVCEHCEAKALAELGRPIPVTVDWNDEAWTAFHSARVRWLEEFWVALRDAARAVRPGIPIAHNFAATIGGWYNASTTAESARDTFTGGDLYGGRDQQLVISKMMHSISAEQPAEYMTSRTPDLRYHVQLRSERELLVQALGAVAHHHAFLFIDAIDPKGTVQDGVYDRMGAVFAEVAKYENKLGGIPVAEIAVYFSDHAKMNWREAGRHIADGPDPVIPHQYNFFGACRTLQEAHLPFGIITKSQLKDVSEYRVLVLPDVTRMDNEEIAMITEFVRAGGRVYASGQTSLGDTVSGRLSDYALSDVFGVHKKADYEGGVLFVKPVDERVASAMSPENYVSWGLTPTMDLTELAPVEKLDVPIIASHSDARVLATLTLPYGYPHAGGLREHGFASIHSSPPWDDTDSPAIVYNQFGQGAAVYSVAPIEGSPDHASRQLFADLVTFLNGDTSRLAVVAPDNVWVTMFDQVENSRIILSALNFDEREHGSTARVMITAGAPVGYTFSSVIDVPAGVRVSISGDGSTLEVEDDRLELFWQLEVALSPAPE